MTRLRRVAMACLYVLIIAATLWLLGQVVTRLAVVVIPIAVALLLAALFAPVVVLLTRRGVPRGLATAIVLLVGIAVTGGVFYVMYRTLASGLPELGDQLDGSYRKLRTWLTDGPLGLSSDQLDDMLRQGKDWVNEHRGDLASGALGALSTVGALLAGLAFVLFVLIFLLKDGPKMWQSIVGLLPASARDRADVAGGRAFHDLTAFVRTTMLVALLDAVGIGVGLWVTGVPLVLPLSALVFFGAFVPIIGAFVTGVVAVLVALVSKGLLIALVVAGIVVLIQQLEGNVLEPLLMSRSVRLHPVVVLVGVAVGVELAGVVGALFAVPVLAVVRSVALSLRESSDTERESTDTEKDTREPDPA